MNVGLGFFAHTDIWTQVILGDTSGEHVKVKKSKTIDTLPMLFLLQPDKSTLQGVTVLISEPLLHTHSQVNFTMSITVAL